MDRKSEGATALVEMNLECKVVSPLLSVIPVVDILLRLVLRNAIAFLDFSFELIALALDLIELVVRELASLLFHFSLHLLPIAFHAIPIHMISPSSGVLAQRGRAAAVP